MASQYCKHPRGVRWQPGALEKPHGLRLMAVESHTMMGSETILRAMWHPWQPPLNCEFDFSIHDITDPGDFGWVENQTRLKFGLHDYVGLEPGHTYRVMVRMSGNGRMHMSEWSDPAVITMPGERIEPPAEPAPVSEGPGSRDEYLDRIAAATLAAAVSL